MIMRKKYLKLKTYFALFLLVIQGYHLIKTLHDLNQEEHKHKRLSRKNH